MKKLHIMGRQFTIFTTVARLLSFTKAAELQHMTQPAVTFQIKGAESAAGVRLFDRTHNRVTLTDAGKIVLKYAELVVGLESKMHAELDKLVSKDSNKIRVGYSPALSGHVLSNIAANLRRTDETAEYEFVQTCSPDENNYDMFFTNYNHSGNRSHRAVHQGVYVRYTANSLTQGTCVAHDADIPSISPSIPSVVPAWSNYTTIVAGIDDCIVPEYAMATIGGGTPYEIYSDLTSCLYIVKPIGFVSERVTRIIEQYSW